MRKTLSILTTLLTGMLAIQCNPDIPVEPGKPLSVELESASVILPYAEPVKLNYTIMNADGGIDVKIQSLPSTIGYTNHYTGGANGYVELLSSLDDNKTFNVYVTVKDGKTTVNKDVKITTTKKDVPFSINITGTTVEMTYGKTADLQFTATGFKGDVSVSLKNAVQGFSLEASDFNKTAGNGTLTFSTSLKEPSQVDAVLVFSDTKTDIEKSVVLKSGSWSAAPSKPSVSLDSDIIYPYECNAPLEIPFTVDCEDVISQITVTASKGLEASVSTSEDKKSGTITVKAKENLGDNGAVNITASNGAGSATTEISLQKAYLNVSKKEMNVTNKETQSGDAFNIQVWTNLEISASLNDPDNFISWWNYNGATGGGNLYFGVKENSSYVMRTATVKITEPKGLLDVDVKINQVGIEGNYDTDRAALIAIYEALNMKEWNDYGAFGFYYRNWCTDEPLDYWLGVTTTRIYEKTGRVSGLSFLGTQPKSTGYIPEELGQLTKLREFQLFPYHRITHLPESIENLLELQSFSLNTDYMDHIDLSEWTGLTRLMNNPNNHMKWLVFGYTGLHGTIPDWLTKVNYDYFQFSIEGCHFSGQVPDAVAKMEFWHQPYMYSADELKSCPRFDPTKYELSEDGWYYKVPHGEAMMYLQADNYALWEGERPANTKWVDDNLGGHWEWVY